MALSARPYNSGMASLRYLAFVLLTSLFLFVSCSKSPEQKQAEQAAKTVQEGAKKVAEGAEKAAQSSAQVTQGLQQVTQGLQQLSQSKVKPLDFEVLKAALPDVAGWTRSNVKGEQVSMGAATTSRAEARYHRDGSEVELEVVDTAFSQLLLAPISMFLTNGYDERSDEGFKRATKVAGQPAFEEWNQRSARGEVTTVVAGRFILHARGHDVKSIDPVRAVVEAVDLKTLR